MLILETLNWCGLRGGISFALALPIPPVPERPTNITITCITVVFTTVVQGMTLRKLVDRIYPKILGEPYGG